jgi:FKBP-type peptidyl-prolyl cis-trans isomerase FklB
MFKKIALSACLTLSLAAQSFAQNDSKPSSSDFSYSYGVLVGESMRTQGFAPSDVDLEAFLEGLQTSLKGKKTKIDQKKAQEIVMGKIQELQARKAREKELENKKFFTENATKKGVKTLESGIQYIVMNEGSGAIPKASDKVTTHYHGTLLNGTIFDSSVDRGQPATFPVGGVIKGWQEVLQLMKTGAKWKVFIPASLAYGDRNQGKIPANSTLVFEIELLEIAK